MRFKYANVNAGTFWPQGAFAARRERRELREVKLRRAGLVKSVRGPRGGFRLSRPPSEITVGDIVRAVEGPVGLAPCVTPESCYGGRGKRKTVGNCPQAEYCAARLVWEKLSREIERALDETDLRQVLNDSQRLRARV